ncbi:alpha/beta hydrolase [Ideonella paludis]|uniref:Alpha/beta hydrolase n=1 Tax=Ideonella paludis TaxID=1233411 RepID=A0ABS5DRB8_9BURK|nr:alpha/beta hydrolase [Ideonella paludis]MBQ0933701.1 alpha/beta hydrolase [Ideonella paludis]
MQTTFLRLLAIAVTACGMLGHAWAQTIPTRGPYAYLVHSSTAITKVLNVPFSTRSNPLKTHFTTSLRKDLELTQDTLTLELDVYMPPTATAATRQPLVVWVHSGNLVKGAKEENADKLLSYSRAGYVAAAVNYRMNKTTPKTPTDIQGAHTRAMEDVANAVRYLRVNAATYGIDPTRVAVLGISSGGTLSMMMATDSETLVGAINDFPGVSAKTDAAVSTGATFVQPTYNAFTFLTTEEDDTDVLLFHANPTDRSTKATWEGNAVPTCNWISSSGNVCQLVAQPDMTHTVNLNVGPSEFWPYVREFLWFRLRLDEISK